MRPRFVQLLLILGCVMAGVPVARPQASPRSEQPRPLSAAEAADHLGEHATVCGQVVSTKYASTSRGQPTFLNLDRPYPRHIFTVVIWGEDRAKFGSLEGFYKNKRICVTGRIESHRGQAQIVARDPSQITIEVTGEPSPEIRRPRGEPPLDGRGTGTRRSA